MEFALNFDPEFDQECFAIFAAYFGLSGFPADPDGDNILTDGDFSGIINDNPCTGGDTGNCDDNCPNNPNPDQADSDGDGIGDVCDTDEGISVQPGPEDGEDVWITSVYYDYGKNDQQLKCGGWGDYYYSLLRFNIDDLPDNVGSAKIYLYCNVYAWDRPVSPYLDKVTSNWNEETRWQTRPSYQNITTILAPALHAWHQIDITNLYNSWKDGTTLNYGIQLRPTSNSQYGEHFWSSDYLDDPSLRPKLVISP